MKIRFLIPILLLPLLEAGGLAAQDPLPPPSYYQQGHSAQPLPEAMQAAQAQPLVAQVSQPQATEPLPTQPQPPAMSDAPAAAQPAAQPVPRESSDAMQPPDPQLKQNPLVALRNFQPPADEEYRLGRGDEITIDFAGRTDLQAKLIVGPDGRITLPLAGDIVLNGLTRTEAAKAIESSLSSYYQNLSVQVTVTKYTANRILVLGAVEKPGLVSFEGTPTLLEALTRAGIGAGPAPAKAAPMPERCAIYRGQDQVVWVELKKLIDSGSGLADLRLRRDDVVYVPGAAESFISVLGEVQRPGAVQLTSSSTLSSVLAESGGFTAKAGNRPHIQIVDPSSGVSRSISFNDLLNPAKALEITLKPGELIFVPQTGFARATYVLERLNPLVTAGTFALATGGVL
jgi:polysaccharide export outer membrane protein